MTTTAWHHYRRSRSQRGSVARGCLVAVGLASGLAGALALQVAGPQLQNRFATWLGIAPDVHTCRLDMAPENPAPHAPKAHAMAASYGVGVMPAI